MIESNEKNLYDFYRLIGSGRFASLVKGSGYYAVSGSHGSWPQMIFDGQNEKKAGVFLNRAFSTASEFPDVRFAICNKALIAPGDQDVLRLNEIFPVGYWQLMEINATDDLKFKMPDGYKLRRLNEPAEIDEFVSLVNSDMMMNLKVNREIFQELVQHAGIDIYGLFIGDELASGLLAYSGLNKVAGLYFITTKLGYRGKGLAAGITGYAVKSLFGQGIGKVVLQAMPKAVTLYTRLGFIHRGELVIFWKK